MNIKPLLHQTVVDLVLDIICLEKDAIYIKSMKMQEQKVYDACGVYSLAVATALCTKKMHQCFIESKKQCSNICCSAFKYVEHLTAFPLDGKASSLPNKHEAVTTTIVHDLYYICRQRYKPKVKMKQCKECNGWFHVDCLNIPATAEGRSLDLPS